MAISKGSTVRQVIKPIQGVVEKFDVDPDSGELKVLVSWVDEHGTQSRYFRAADMEEVTGD